MPEEKKVEATIEASVVNEPSNEAGDTPEEAHEKTAENSWSAEPHEAAAKAHTTGEEIGRAITGVVVTGGSFVVGLAKGLGKPIVDKISEISKDSQGKDIGEQANEAFSKGVEKAQGWTSVKDDGENK